MTKYTLYLYCIYTNMYTVQYIYKFNIGMSIKLEFKVILYYLDGNQYISTQVKKYGV